MLPPRWAAPLPGRCRGDYHFVVTRPSTRAQDGRPRVDLSRLSPPKRHGRVCERRELIQSLEDAGDSRVTLILAPAGYGKTTVISQWCERLAERQTSIAYYSASERDRDAATFLFMIANALDLAGVDMAGSAALTSSDVLPGAAIDHILVRIELTGQPLTLVIDDFERVENAETLAIVKAMVDALPAALHLVLVSRRRPNLPLAALDVQGQLRIVDASRLRLNRDELAWFLELPPDSQDVADITRRTEGWPVAVQLYRLWLQRRSPDQHPRFGGHVAEVADYLTEELFSSLTQDQRALLIDIASCEEVEPSLVDCMRHRADSAQLLDEIAQTLSTLVRRSEGIEGPIYRLHPLLLENLRARLAREPKHVAELSANAAIWYLRHQRYPDAMRRALDGHDDEVMRQVLRELRPIHVLLAHGVAMLRAILREIPESVIAKHPRLQLMAAIAHFKAASFSEARQMLERIRVATNGFRDDPDGEPDRLSVWGNFVDLVFMTQVARPSPRTELLYSTVIAESGDEPTLWAACENVMMLTFEVRGELDAAKGSILKARRLYESVGMPRYGNLQIIGHELLIALAEADLRRATELIARYQKQPALEIEDDISIPSMLKLTLAAIRYEREFDDQSVEMLQKALAEHGASESWFEQYAIVYPCMLIRLNLHYGAESVYQFLVKARAQAENVGLESLPLFLDALEVEYRSRNGDAHGAAQIAESMALRRCIEDAVYRRSLTWRERDATAQALVMLSLARSEPEHALRYARLLATEGEQGGRLRSQIKGLVLCVRALDAAQDAPAACAELRKAVLLAYPQGFVAPFGEEGERLSRTLAALSDDAACDAFAQRHIKAIQRAVSDGMRSTKGTNLNERELEIVSYLARGASNKVIGRRLGITENTVKFHLKKIFSKLDVSTRRAAVATLLARGVVSAP